MNKHTKSSGINFLSIALVGAIAATLGVMFAPKKGEDIRQDIAEKANELVKKFKENRKEIQKNIEEAFGEFSDDLERNYIEMRADILAKAEEAKDLSEQKYAEIVDDTVSEFARGKKWSKDVSEKLKKKFRRNWEDIKDQSEEVEDL